MTRYTGLPIHSIIILLAIVIFSIAITYNIKEVGKVAGNLAESVCKTEEILLNLSKLQLQSENNKSELIKEKVKRATLMVEFLITKEKNNSVNNDSMSFEISKELVEIHKILKGE
ncbi:MAG: hypothetical protein GY788_02645 [bacterium]|nr:hypothetical protein [bacterium]